MFTDRFIKVPIKVVDKELADFAKDEDWDDSWQKINPLEISQYRPSISTDNQNCTLINMKNGDEVYAYLTPDQFEKILNAYQK